MTSGKDPPRVDSEAAVRGLGEVAALSALGAVWSRSDPCTIALELARILCRSVSAEFVLARLYIDGGIAVESASTRAGLDSDIAVAAIRGELDAYEDSGAFEGALAIANPFGEGRLQVAGIHLGLGGEFGAIFVGSAETAPASDVNRLIVNVAANQAALVLQQRRTESQLRRSERELADFFENSTIGLHWVGPDGTILRANRAELAMLGYELDEYVGHKIAEFHVDQTTISEIMTRLATGEALRDFDAQMRCKDGSIRDVSIDSSVFWEDGEFIHTRCFTRDVTERRHAEETSLFLSRASATLAEVTDPQDALQKIARLAVPFFADWCGVDIRAPDGSLQRLAVEHMDPAKVELAQSLYLRYPPNPDDQSGVMKVLRTGQADWMADIPQSLLESAARDSEHLEVLRQLNLRSYICVPIRKRDKILGILSFVMAESGRRYTESDVQLAEDLAHRAAVAIENASLYSSLKEADRRKDEFLATLAHELRNPLAPIRNGVELLNRIGPPDPELVAVRNIIARQVGHMARLVDDLLDISRITLGKIRLFRERVDLWSIVTNAMELVMPMIEARGHRVHASPPPEPVFATVDVHRMTQTFANLLTNAAKYTDDGGDIWIDLTEQDGEARFSIRDSGIGIAPDHLPKLFEMFSQAVPALERSQGGLGIGLALARGMVEMHDGSIEAHSEGAGKGSEFIVRLPTIQGATGSRDEAVSQGAPPAFEELRILVVDDNRDAADSLAKLLEIQGHTVSVAYDGTDAMRAAAEHAPEMVLLDIGLPDFDGYEVARRIRTSQRGADVVLVALTGWGQDSDKRSALEAGFDLHVTKPVNPAELERLTTGWAARRTARPVA